MCSRTSRSTLAPVLRSSTGHFFQRREDGGCLTICSPVQHEPSMVTTGEPLRSVYRALRWVVLLETAQAQSRGRGREGARGEHGLPRPVGRTGGGRRDRGRGRGG